MNLEIKVTNHETKETYKTNSPSVFYSLKWDDGDKYLNNCKVNKIIKAKEVELSTKFYKAAKVYDTKNDHVVEEKEIEEKPTRWQDEPATTNQYSYMRTLGYYDFKEAMTKGQASFVIDMIKSGDAGSLGMAHESGSY